MSRWYAREKRREQAKGVLVVEGVQISQIEVKSEVERRRKGVFRIQGAIRVRSPGETVVTLNHPTIEVCLTKRC